MYCAGLFASLYCCCCCWPYMRINFVLVIAILLYFFATPSSNWSSICTMKKKSADEVKPRDTTTIEQKKRILSKKYEEGKCCKSVANVWVCFLDKYEWKKKEAKKLKMFAYMLTVFGRMSSKKKRSNSTN